MLETNDAELSVVTAPQNLPLQLTAAALGPSASWPHWAMISMLNEELRTGFVEFNLHKEAYYNVRRKSEEPDWFNGVFQDAAEMVQQIRAAARIANLKAEDLEEEMLRNLTASIYFSNFIEQVGINLAETAELCRRIFSGRKYSPRASPLGSWSTSGSFKPSSVKPISPKPSFTVSSERVVRLSSTFTL